MLKLSNYYANTEENSHKYCSTQQTDIQIIVDFVLLVQI